VRFESSRFENDQVLRNIAVQRAVCEGRECDLSRFKLFEPPISRQDKEIKICNSMLGAKWEIQVKAKRFHASSNNLSLALLDHEIRFLPSLGSSEKKKFHGQFKIA
jgi:hypothetical protein